MNTIFFFGGLLANHIDKNTLKMPPDPDEYIPEEYPHWDVFHNLHIGRAVATGELQGNAEVIAKLTEEEVKKVTLVELLEKGLIMDSPSYID